LSFCPFVTLPLPGSHLPHFAPSRFAPSHVL
jgi:hypothetical protein